jgi:hypothetical protein
LTTTGSTIAGEYLPTPPHSKGLLCALSTAEVKSYRMNSSSTRFEIRPAS